MALEKPSFDESLVGKLFKKAHDLPASVSPEIRQQLADNAAKINGKFNSLKNETKEKTKDALHELKEEAREGLQAYVREEKTAKLKSDPRFEKLLKKSTGFEDVTAGDILRIRGSGENIANFLFTNEDGEEIQLLPTTLENFKEKSFIVNFGENNSLNASIGLGDILPYEVKRVEVTDPNGKKTIGTLGNTDSRKGRRERVGYYDERGRYIPVYHGYRIRILETGAPQEEEKKNYDRIQTTRLNTFRTEEMMEYIIAKHGLRTLDPSEGTKILEDEFHDSQDKELFDTAISQMNTRARRRDHVQESFKGSSKNREAFIEKFGWYLKDVITKDFPQIPLHLLVNLFGQESRFDSTAINPTTRAYGLGQMIPGTWKFIEERTNKSYDRDNPYDQIHATAAYIHWIMNNNSCSVQDALIYYHMGHGVKKYMDRNDQNWLQKYKKSNPAIAERMTENSWQGYWNAAKSYYLEAPDLLASLDLKSTREVKETDPQSPTALSRKLGDYVVGVALPNTGTSSCGKAVGILLNNFGFEDLPQVDRDGKNWTRFLDARPNQFKKVAINHPREAGTGAILVYDGSGELGTAANKQYGHVEIKGSDGKYYHYLESNRAGGSAANNEQDPEKYRKLSGFTGYAYYPIQTEA